MINYHFKTKYYPVTYADILEEIKTLTRWPFLGVGCFIKAIRLSILQSYLQRKDCIHNRHYLWSKIKSLIFLRLFSTQKSGAKEHIANREFRSKGKNGNALDYSYSCVDSNSHKVQLLRMRTVGDMGDWLFQSKRM